MTVYELIQKLETMCATYGREATMNVKIQTENGKAAPIENVVFSYGSLVLVHDERAWDKMTAFDD